MQNLDLSLRVLVHGEGVDYAYGVGLSQALQLGDDLAVELRVLETEHDQLDRSDGHETASIRSRGLKRLKDSARHDIAQTG